MRACRAMSGNGNATIYHYTIIPLPCITLKKFTLEQAKSNNNYAHCNELNAAIKYNNKLTAVVTLGRNMIFVDDEEGNFKNKFKAYIPTTIINIIIITFPPLLLDIYWYSHT